MSLNERPVRARLGDRCFDFPQFPVPPSYFPVQAE